MKNELVSVVISVGERHEDFLDLLEDYDAAIRTRASRYEYVLVVDGDYPEVMDDIAKFRNGQRNINVIELSRSFGHSVAVAAGIEQSKGDLVMTLPPFYQIDPRSIPALFDGLEDNDLAEGRRWPRRDSRINRFSTWLYHRIIRLVTGFDFRDIGCSARLMRRQVAMEVMLYGEQSTFLPLLAANRGFKVREISVPQSTRDPHVRVYGPGIYSTKLLDIFTIFFLIRFTKAPLRFFGVVGSIILIAGLVLIGIVSGDKLVSGVAAADRPALLFGVMLLVLGVQLFALGLIGELIIFTHGRELKEYSVAEVVSEKQSKRPDSSIANIASRR